MSTARIMSENDSKKRPFSFFTKPAFLANIENGKLKVFLREFTQNHTKVIVAVDIDQCGALGEDTNDVARAILTMYPNAYEDKKEALEHVIRSIINARMTEAINTIASKTNGEYRIVLYTQKSNILRTMRRDGVDLPEVDPGTIFFDGARSTDGATYLADQCNVSQDAMTTKNELLRLGLVTWAIGKESGQELSPPVFVTETKKDLEIVAKHLRVDPKKVYLYDDKSEKHIKELGNKPFAAEHMLSVDKFNMTSNDAEKAKALEAFLNEHFPMTELCKQNPALYRQIFFDPSWPEENRCLNPNGTWRLHYEGRGEPVKPWDTTPVLEGLDPRAAGRSLTWS